MLRHDAIHLGMRVQSTTPRSAGTGKVVGLQLRNCSTPEGGREDCAGILVEVLEDGKLKDLLHLSTHDDLTILDPLITDEPLPFWYTDLRLGRRAQVSFKDKKSGEFVTGTGIIVALYPARHRVTKEIAIKVTVLGDEAEYETTHHDVILLPEEEAA